MGHPSGKAVLNLLRVSRLPIYHQLLLEEALLRNTKDNWVLINDGAFHPAIVMGISGKPEELVNIPAASQARIQVIKRFTGGGTVVVDQDTIFTSLIFQGSALPEVECFPQPVMRWTETFYAHAFKGLHVDGQGFALRESDYVFGEHKFGGNAQAITGRRWLHHTSLLWGYQPERMSLLTQPKKAPKYRQGRTHKSFLVPLSQVCTRGTSLEGPHDSRDSPRQTLQPPGNGEVEQARRAFLNRLIETAYNLPGFVVEERTIGEASAALQGKGHCGTRIIDLNVIQAQQTEASLQSQAQA